MEARYWSRAPGGPRNVSHDELVTRARDVARITHSHHLGVTGGIVQALAVYHALHGDKPGQILEKIKSCGLAPTKAARSGHPPAGHWPASFDLVKNLFHNCSPCN